MLSSRDLLDPGVELATPREVFSSILAWRIHGQKNLVGYGQ